MSRHSYPLLTEVRGRYARIVTEKGGLANVLVYACIDLLEPELRLLEHLIGLGLRPENCVVAGKAYSGNMSMRKRIMELGCTILPISTEYDPTRPFNEWYMGALYLSLAQECNARNVNAYDAVIILDRGGFMHLALYKLFGFRPNFFGIEMTGVGANRIKRAGVEFKSIAPLSEIAPLYESVHLAEHIYDEVQVYMHRYNRPHPRMLVVGLGPLSSNFANLCFVREKHEVFATDLRGVSDTRGLGVVQKLQYNRRLLAPVDAYAKLSTFDVVVSASLSGCIVSASELERLRPYVLLISLRPTDTQFPLEPFRELGQEVHDDCASGGRRLVNSGFPAYYRGEENCFPPEDAELTVAVVLDCLLAALTGFPHPSHSIYDVIHRLWLKRYH